MFETATHNEIDSNESCGKRLFQLSHSFITVAHEGRISRIGMIPGILYVIENGTQRTYGINLRDLEGYRGESLKELGFRVGAQVRFHTEGEQHVVMAANI